MRTGFEWALLAITAVLLTLAGAAFARRHDAAPPPIVTEVPAPRQPPDPRVWFATGSQVGSLSVVDGWVAWRDDDGVHMTAAADRPPAASAVTTFEDPLAVEGPIIRPRVREACWVTSRSVLRCGSPDRPAEDVAETPGSVIEMTADEAGIVFAQFDGRVIEVRGSSLRRLATLANAWDLTLDGNVAYVVALDPLRIVRLSRANGAAETVFERDGPRVGGESAISTLGSLLADRDALYIDTQDRRDGLNRVLRIAKRDGGVTTLYEGFAHVAITAIHGATLYGVSAPDRAWGELNLEAAVAVTLPTRGGPLRRIRTPATPEHIGSDLVIGWGGSVRASADGIYFTDAPRNPIGARDAIWRLTADELP